jgi:hypothetical protein
MHCRIIQIGRKLFDETLAVHEGRCCTSCVSDDSEIAGRTVDLPMWNLRKSVGNDLWQMNIKSLQKLAKCILTGQEMVMFGDPDNYKYTECSINYS